MKNKFGILVLVMSMAPALVLAGMWTNAAGHGVEAELVSIKDGNVTLQRTKGQPFTMNISGFCTTDQKRIRKHFGLDAVPKPVSAKDLAFEKQMARLRELRTSGKMDDKEFHRQQSAMLDHFYGQQSK